jgi:hypothetical protein
MRLPKKKLKKLKKIAPMLFAVLFCYAAAGGCCYWSLTRRPLNEADCATIQGTLKSAREVTGGRKTLFLELYIAESHIRFRVPNDGYRDYFKRQAFFDNVKPGSKISITARKTELEKPNQPPLDPVDTVFVYGLKDDRMIYCSVADRKGWEATNRILGFTVTGVLALAAIALTGGLAWVILAPKN